MSSVDWDGSHITALRGGEQDAYKGLQKRKTTNALYLIDRQGIPLAMSHQTEGNHNDLHQIKEHFTDIIESLHQSNIKIEGLFLNADAGFDSMDFREFCFADGIIPNIAINYRNGTNSDDIFLMNHSMNNAIV